MADLSVQPETTVDIDLPEDYKETELGLLPEEWKVIELRRVIAGGPQNGLYKPQSLYGGA